MSRDQECTNSKTTCCPNIFEFMIPEGVTKIESGQFEGMLSLTSITLPASLIRIEEKAFFRTGVIDVNVKEGIKKFECEVPEFIKKILESKGIECPNSYHDEEDTRRELIEQFKLIKNKWEITIDMMIIGKYFKTSEDFVNVMKITKKYDQLVLLYHFNPISECELFENMETQYLYDKNDIKKEEMSQYVYWYEVDYEVFKNRNENEIFKSGVE